MTASTKKSAKRVQLISHWKHSWKLTSVWVFLVIGAFPDIYNAVIAAGLHDSLSDPAKMWLRGLAVVGIALRLIKQNVVNGAKDGQDSSNK